MQKTTHVFIMGAKGLHRNYGGWETFVSQLLANWQDDSIQFYVPEIVHTKKEETILHFNDVLCPQIQAPQLGGATMVIFAAKAFLWALKVTKKEKLQNPIFYVLGLRIGPLVYLYRHQLKRLGIKVLINPDGMEWKRAKWNILVKKYFLASEKTMYLASDLIVCDSQAIEHYVNDKYPDIKAQTTFIPYGAYPKEDLVLDDKTQLFFDEHQIKAHDYYLIVGRFVPENNFELILKEFMRSKTKKELVIITNLEYNRFYEQLKTSTHFDQDPRIKFVGTVYDAPMLVKIRNQAFAYLHGHSAGGTNPSLLEALGTTNLNLLFDVDFNREVGDASALYFNGELDSLSHLIHQCDDMDEAEIIRRGQMAKSIISSRYTWKSVVDSYANVFKADTTGKNDQ